MSSSRWAIVGLLLMAAAGSCERQGQQLSVAVAISLKEAMGEVAAAYKAETGTDVQFTFGASGQLMAQVQNGAAIDAFVSAAAKQVDELIASGHLVAKTRRDVAGNALVLVVPAGAGGGTRPGSFEDLADAKFGRVAVGEPKSVPAGQYAMQVLTKLGVADALLADGGGGGGRLVYGANVRQVLDYVARGEVAAGVVYATDARTAGDTVRVVATAGAGTHEPIVYPAAVVTASPRREAAGRFLDFLGGEKGRRILTSHGFTIPQSNGPQAGGRDATDPARTGTGHVASPSGNRGSVEDVRLAPVEHAATDEPASRESVAR